MIKTEHPGVYTLKDGRYKISVAITCPRTKRRRWRRKTMPEGATIEDALHMRDHLKSMPTEEPVPERTTLASYAAQWMSLKRSRLKHRTYITYATALEMHILPIFGELYIDCVVRADVEMWVAYAETKTQPCGAPYADATLKSWWRPLKQMLQDAAADHGFTDPTARIRPPKVYTDTVRETRTLSRVQLAAYLDATAQYEPAWYPMILTMAYTGVRLGELLGLRWCDVDYDGECLSICQTVSSGIISDTKTHTPRVVYMPELVGDVLREHRKSMMQDQHPGLASGLVFPANNGKPRFGSVLRKPMRFVSEHLVLDFIVTPQVLRRTFNTLLVQAGVDRIVLRAQMGHTSEQMTARYSGISTEAKKVAVQSVFTSVHK